MEAYITYMEFNEKGQAEYFILQKAFPHFLAKVSPFPSTVLVDAAPIAGYNLYMRFSYTLRGMEVPSYKNIIEEIQMVLMDMAAWYLQNRIIKEPKRYFKFKIKT